MGTSVDLAGFSGRSGRRTQTARLRAEMTALREAVAAGYPFVTLLHRPATF